MNSGYTDSEVAGVDCQSMLYIVMYLMYYKVYGL